MSTSVKSFRSSNARSLFVAGATLAGAFVVNFALIVSRTAGTDDPSALAYYASNGPLLVGWGALFVATAFLAREWGTHPRLWRLGAAWTVLGFAAVTAGFVGVVLVAPLGGGMAAADVGNTIAGIAMLLGVVPGTLLLGVATLHERSVSRSGAAALVAGGLSLLVGFLTVGMLPQAALIVLWMGLAVGWSLFGYATIHDPGAAVAADSTPV